MTQAKKGEKNLQDRWFGMCESLGWERTYLMQGIEDSPLLLDAISSPGNIFIFIIIKSS